MSKFYSSFVQGVVVPVYDLARKTSRFKFSRVLSKTQWLPREEIDKLQTMNLRLVLRHAYDSVPYYRRIFRERQLTPGDIRNADDLVKLPVLTKADIRHNSSELVSRVCSANQLVTSRSGGTGDQIRFYVTREQLSWEVAAEFRAYGWAGYKLGDRCLMFWGSPVDMSRQASLVKRFTSYLERVVVVNTYVAADEVLAKYAEIMRLLKPEIVRGYASSVYLMAKFLLREGLECPRPRTVLTSAETLFPDQRRTIEKAFGCPVFDYYGSREVGAIAAECERHNGYHVSAENVLLEYVRNGEHVAPGEDGVILVTSLRNFGMPFIRYAIGDVGKHSDESCVCGRGLPLMASIEGRVSQFMAIYDKKLKRIVPVSTAAPGPFSMALMQVPLESYRIVQKSLDRVVIKAVKGKSYTQEHTAFLTEHLRKILGDNIKVEFEFMDYLPPLPSGKRSVFISNINPFQDQ